MPPLRNVLFFSIKQSLNVFRKVIVVLVTLDINYKPSMKNVQYFYANRFLTEITFVPLYQ